MRSPPPLFLPFPFAKYIPPQIPFLSSGFPAARVQFFVPPMDCVFVEIEARQGFLFGPLRIKIFGTGAFATLGFEEDVSELG